MLALIRTQTPLGEDAGGEGFAGRWQRTTPPMNRQKLYELLDQWTPAGLNSSDQGNRYIIASDIWVGINYLNDVRI
jgi:hypothetical protein